MSLEPLLLTGAARDVKFTATPMRKLIYYFFAASAWLNIVAVCGALIWLWRRVDDQRQRHVARALHHQNRRDIFATIPCHQPGGVLLLGDSHTERGLWSELLPQHQVFNRGISGDTSEGLLLRWEDAVRCGPDYAFIMVGFNDLASRIEPSRIVRNLQQILVGLKSRAPAPTIWLQSIPPVEPRPEIEVSNSRIRGLNRQLYQLARDHNVGYIDLASQLGDENGDLPKHLTQDGVHLKGNGYAIWAESISDALTNAQ